MDELAVLRALHRPGTIVDVGAHDGALAVPLAALPGARVVAFEPLPPAFARLRAAVAGLPVELRPQALGVGPGRLVLEAPVIGGILREQWASVAKDYAAIAAADPRVEGVERWEVEVVALDSLDLTDVTAMKLDAEGAEEEVLRGAEATLRRCRPVLTVEIEERHRAGSTVAVPALLAGWGYRGFFQLDGAWRGIGEFDAAMQVASVSPASFEASDPYVFVFLFLPEEQLREGGLRLP
jgi:FkbM family methyltransferase